MLSQSVLGFGEPGDKFAALEFFHVQGLVAFDPW